MHYVTLAFNFEFMQISSLKQIISYPLLFVPFVSRPKSQGGMERFSDVIWSRKMIVDSEGARKKHINA